MAERVKERGIPTDKIYKISERYSWALDFYNREPVKIVSEEELLKMHEVRVYATDEEVVIRDNLGFHWLHKITVDQFRITRLTLKFLNPSTRAKKLNKMHLVYLD